MKEKITREEFLKLKEEIIEVFNEALAISEEEMPSTIDENAENYRELEEAYEKEVITRMQEPLERYKLAIEKLLSFNLSEIAAEDWAGMVISGNGGQATDMPIIRLDFSETFANLDFSLVEFYGDNVDLHSCLITNIEMAKTNLILSNEDEFDERTILANPNQFVSRELPDDVRKRFYSQEVTLKDLITYEEIFKKAKGHMSWYFQTTAMEQFLERVTFEELQKLDFELIEILGFEGRTVISTIFENPDIDVDGFNEAINQEIRQRIIKDGPRRDYTYSEEFKRKNPDLIFREDNPELFDTLGYSNIGLEKIYMHAEALKGKKIKLKSDVERFFEIIGEDMFQILTETLTYEQASYLLKVFENDYNATYQELTDKIDFEKLLALEPLERGKVLNILAETQIGESTENLEHALELEKVMEREKIRFSENDEIVKKYGIENFIAVGVTNVDVIESLSLETSLEKLKEYTEHIDIRFFLQLSHQENDANAIRKYGIDFYIDRGFERIYEIMSVRGNGLNLNQMQEMIAQGIDLEALLNSPNIINFINTFGIDNILRLNEESQNMFSSKENSINANLKKISEVYALMEKKYEGDGKISYEDFVKEIVKIVVASKEKKDLIPGILSISESVKKEIPEEFISVEELERVLIDNPNKTIIINQTLNYFNSGILTADFIKQYPEIVPVLQQKDIKNAMKIDGIISTVEESNTNPSDEKTSNIAKYISEKFGNSVLLEFCTKYGKHFDFSNLSFTGEETLEELKQIIEKAIYESVKTNLKYSHEDMDDEFKKNYPELYLDYEVDEDIKKKFYEKNLNMQDLKDPKVRKALEGKDLKIGAGLYFNIKTEIRSLYENLKREEFYSIVDEYGRYLEGIDIGNITELLTQSKNPMEDLKKKIEESIEKNIFERKTHIDDQAPKFFKSKYPQYFIDGLEQEERDVYYDFQGIATLEEFYEFYKCLSEESQKAFEGKNIIMNFPIQSRYVNKQGIFGAPRNVLVNSYEEFFKNFSMDEILGKFSKYGPQLDRIVSEKKEDLLKKAYEKYGEIVLQAPELICAITEEQLDNVNFAHYVDLVKNSNFHLNNGYQKENAERLVAKMYLFLGYDNATEFFRLPEMSKEELVRAIEERENEFDEACEVRFSLKGDIQIVTEFFRKLDLTEYQYEKVEGDEEKLKKNKKIPFEILKKLNMNLEEGFDGTLEELLEDSISKAGKVPNKDEIAGLVKYLNSMLTSQKMEKLNPYIMNVVNENLTAVGSNRKIIVDILLEELRKNLLKNVNINKESLIENLRKEILEKKKPNGTPYYSQHVTDHFGEIENIILNLLENEKIQTITSYSTIDCIKSERKKIGSTWIRKVQNVPSELSLEQIEKLEKTLYGEEVMTPIEFKKRVVVKSEKEEVKEEQTEGQLGENKKTEESRSSKEKAYLLFGNLDNQLILTLSKAEVIFDGIQPPYSQEFIKFLMANKKEILTQPKFYTKVPNLHNEFDKLIEIPEIKNRYDKGEITAGQLFDLLKNNDRPYGTEQEGDWELSKRARKSSLTDKQFEIAQKILCKMREREYQTVPPVRNKTTGKYRGRIVRSDDPLHIVVGKITTCCQHIGGYGETSMLHSAIEKNGSLFVVEELDEFGNVVDIVAQSWTWRNNDTICFDNVEMPDTLKPKLSEQDYEEITQVYEESAKSMIKTDAKMMKKMLDEGKITQEQYDELVVKEVRVGLGCNDLITLDQNGKFDSSKQKILPIEMGKSYPEYADPNGFGKKELYADAHNSKILVRIEDIQDEIEQMPNLSTNVTHDEDKLENIPVGYDKSRDILCHKGRTINLDDIKAMERMRKLKTSDKSYRFEGIELRMDMAETLGVEDEQIRFLMSRDEDWYILSTETDDSIKIEDAVRNSSKEDEVEKISISEKIAGLEIASSMYELFIEANKKNKRIIIESEYNSSDINFESLVEKGVITLSGECGNKVIQVIDRERLEEEVRKIKEVLEKEEELLIIQGKLKKQEEPYEKPEEEAR